MLLSLVFVVFLEWCNMCVCVCLMCLCSSCAYINVYATCCVQSCSCVEGVVVVFLFVYMYLFVCLRLLYMLCLLCVVWWLFVVRVLLFLLYKCSVGCVSSLFCFEVQCWLFSVVSVHRVFFGVCVCFVCVFLLYICVCVLNGFFQLCLFIVRLVFNCIALFVFECLLWFSVVLVVFLVLVTVYGCLVLI